MTGIEDAVRAWARGIYPTEAGVELLIRHGKTIYEGAPWLTEIEPSSDGRPRMVGVDVDVLLDHAGAWSGGEQRVVRVAASFLGGPPVDLGEDVPGMDRACMKLVLAAMAHAAGTHEDSEPVFEGGQVVRLGRLERLYEWPGE